MAEPEASTRASATGLAAIGGATIAWGFSAVIIDLTPATALVIVFWRLWIASALLLALTHATGRRMSRDVWKAGAIPGVLLCGDMALFFSAVQHTSVAEATIIGALQPAFVILIARPLFAERIGRGVGALTAVAMAAVSAVVLGRGLPNSHHLSGDLLATGSMLTWTAYWLTSKRARERVEALEFTAAVTLAAAVVVTPIVFLFGKDPAHVHTGAWVWIALLAIVPGSGHLLINWAHRFVDVSLSSVVVATNPVVAVIGAAAILHQHLNGFQVLAGVVALIAIVLVVWRTQQASTPPLEPIVP